MRNHAGIEGHVRSILERVGILRTKRQAGPFVRHHLGDGNGQTGAREIDKSWAEAIKILLRYEPVDEDVIACALAADESTLALLYFHLHFYLIRKSGEWIHDGSR